MHPANLPPSTKKFRASIFNTRVVGDLNLVSSVLFPFGVLPRTYFAYLSFLFLVRSLISCW